MPEETSILTTLIIATPPMSQPSISIIGAGLSGLVLGRCLLQRGISSVIFEREAAHTASKRHGYGITLHPWAYRPLLKYLELDEEAIKKDIAVDSAVGGVGRIGSSGKFDVEASSFRANRRRLENILKEGLDIRWGYELSEINIEGELNIVVFRNGHQTYSTIVVGADGPHSQTRKCISSNMEPNILPFVVYNGKRRVDCETFDEKYASYMDRSNIIERKQGETLMQITVNDRNNELVNISYTYSRPAHRPDPTFKPDRPVSGASDIPDELFHEIAALQDLEGPFREVFDAVKMRDDRLLNWLMRSVLVKMPELHKKVDHGVVLIGDAVHAGPILGGYGANAAINDGIELAEYIRENGTRTLARFYEARYEAWRECAVKSEQQLAKMHANARSNM